MRFINGLQAGAALLVAGAGAAPLTPAGLWMLCAAVVAARVCIAGLFTLMPGRVMHAVVFGS